MEQPAAVRVDLSEVRAFGISGVAALVHLRDVMAMYGARVEVTAAAPVVARLLRIAALGDVLADEPGDGRVDDS